MEKPSIAELLKDCPKGMELYSPLCGKCYFDRLNYGTIICKKQNTQEITFTSEGYYMLPIFDDCECMIFPSKDNRDWSKFQKPFKDGDVVCDIENTIIIYKKISPVSYCGSFASLYRNNIFIPHYVSYLEDTCRFATDEEKEKLFDAIKANGYKWYPDTKSLVKLFKPNFKVGDTIKNKTDKWLAKRTIKSYVEGVGYFTTINDWVKINEQDNWELVPNKFDINTLVPFESRVLMRSSNAREWVATFYSHYSNNKFYGCGMCCDQCIPYEGNEHLLGKTDDCDKYFKTWK